MGLNKQELVNLRDLKILDDIREIYHQNTGMVISFHYPGRNDLWDFFPKKQKNEFCKIIQASDEGMQRCLASDRRGFAEAKQKVGPIVTDNGNFIIDVDFGMIENPLSLDKILQVLSGVVDTGLFVNMVSKAYIGEKDGSVLVLEK